VILPIALREITGEYYDLCHAECSLGDHFLG
jgi:hypothetical protein